MQMIEQLYQLFLQSTGVSTDTRKVEKGNLFFALKGPSFNGNEFASTAIDQGALAVVVDEEVQLPDTAHCFRVDDVLTTLQDLARHHRKQLSNTIVVGLTGSNGKTTAKELFNSVLSTEKRVSATVGNLNNHIGVPLTLLRIPEDTEVAIVEMGANHQKEIEHLSGISLPDIGYITNFGKSHLEGFGGVEGVIKGKSELYVRLGEINSTALVNANDPIQMEKSSTLNRITYGADSSDYPMDFSNQNYPAEVQYKETTFTSNLTGNFHTANIGAAIALGLHLNLSIENIAKGIAAYVPQNNRNQWQETALNKVMLDAYNANPSSMKASVDSFIEGTPSNRILILGDMFELGAASAEEHQAMVNHLANSEGTEIWLVGEHFLKCTVPNQQFKQFRTTDECCEFVKAEPVKDSSILLKGSRGMHLESIFPFL